MNHDLTYNQPMSMWEIYTKFVCPEKLQDKNGNSYVGPPKPKDLWQVPSHQRNLAWNSATIKKWIEKIISAYNHGGIFLSGSILTYTIGSETGIYINDGAQRTLWVNHKLYEHCKKEGLDFKDILSSIKIQVQRKNYENQKEAIKDFLEQNIQTGVTPYEMGRTRLCDTFSDYSHFWEPKIEEVHDIIRTALIEVGIQVEKAEEDSKRETLHKRRRDDLHLFWKFLSKDKTLYSPNVAVGKIVNPDKALELEDKLCKVLIEVGPKKIEGEIDRFKKQINLSAALYRQEFMSIMGDKRAPNETHFRWWLAVRICFLNKKWPVKKLIKFTKLLISHSRGKSSLFYKDKKGEQSNCNLALARMELLQSVSTIIKFDLESLENMKPRKKVNGLNRRGIHESHADAYVDGGERTVPEAGLPNMARGPSPMTVEEISDL